MGLTLVNTLSYHLGQSYHVGRIVTVSQYAKIPLSAEEARNHHVLESSVSLMIYGNQHKLEKFQWISARFSYDIPLIKGLFAASYRMTLPLASKML